MELHISRATVFDFLLMLFFNIGHLKEKQMASMIAQFLNAHYTKLGIVGFTSLDTKECTMHHEQISIQPCQSEVSLVEIELIDRVDTYLTNLGKTSYWQLNKVVAGVKVEHAEKITRG